MNKIEIIPVEYGKSVLSENQIFHNGDKEKTRPIVFMIYLIRTTDRNILVDAGCITMPGFVMEDFIGPVVALERMGISADDITDVIITHSHHDHIECIDCFKNARIYIQKDEFELGQKYIPDGMNVELFDDEKVICENVKATKIGGHSKGSCIVEIVNSEGTFIIAGDECYSYKCLEYKIPTGNSYCPEKSRQFVEKYSDPSYHILLCHER